MTFMAKDYYKILGVSKDASAEDVKRAYRKLAHRYHPDKNNGSADRFKEINEAYQVLSSPQKRAQYDQFGTAGNTFNGFGGFGRQQTQGFDFNDFSGFGFGGFGDIFEDLFSGVFSQVQTEVEISLTSALLGENIRLRTNQGEEIDFKIPPGTRDGATFRFRGKGLATRNGRGDLLVTVKIRFPRHLSREQKELLEELKRKGL